MSQAQENERIARKLYADWNRRDFDGIAAAVADDAEIVLVGAGTRLHGPDGMLASDRAWVEAFPDGRAEIDSVVASADQVVVEFTGTGTHTGALAQLGVTAETAHA